MDTLDILTTLYLNAKSSEAESIAYSNLHNYCVDQWNDLDSQQHYCNKQFMKKLKMKAATN